MKRMFACALLLLAAAPSALCQTPDKQAADLEQTLIANTKRVENIGVLKNAADADELVAPDALGVAPGGVMTWAQLKPLVLNPDHTISNLTLSDFKVIVLGADAAIVTYKGTATETFQGRSATSSAYISTAWAKRGGKWVVVFRQISLVPKPPAQP